jgi:hypothetical protein
MHLLVALFALSFPGLFWCKSFIKSNLNYWVAGLLSHVGLFLISPNNFTKWIYSETSPCHQYALQFIRRIREPIYP